MQMMENDVQMCEYANVKMMENDVQMCECADDGKQCADEKIIRIVN
jgi:hypothetical protein